MMNGENDVAACLYCFTSDFNLVGKIQLIVNFQHSNELATALSRIASDQDLHNQVRVGGLQRPAQFSFEK